MLLDESTPFSAHEIECRPVETTGFVSLGSQAERVWHCDLAPYAPLFRASAWELVFTSLADPLSVSAGQLQATMATLVTSLRTTELPRWLVTDLGPRILDNEDPENDRRLYALAAVQRLQRLLGLNQDEVASLVGVSRPTLWNWEQGRTPQERSLRRLSDVAGLVDLLLDATGSGDRFEAAVVETQLNLDEPLLHILQREDGPATILDRLFARSRESAKTPSLLPSVKDLLADEELDAIQEAPPASRPSGPRQLRSVTRRQRQ